MCKTGDTYLQSLDDDPMVIVHKDTIILVSIITMYNYKILFYIIFSIIL